MQIRKVGVVGCGLMGGGIAQVCAQSGFETVVREVSQAALDQGLRRIESILLKDVGKGKLGAEAKDAALARIQPTLALDTFADCQIVIEAIVERLDAKRELFAALDQICPPATIFASNTSTLSITEIAGASGRDDRVVGLHFCLPAQLMKLIEVSPGIATSDETFAKAWGWCEAAGQLPVKTQDKTGFILNALLIPFNNDCIRAVEAGVASAADVDTAIKTAFGYKMGPLELVDLVGLDTQVRLCEAFYPITLDPRAAAPPLLRRMVAAGWLGRKTGRGFFKYNGNAMFGA